MKLSATQLRRIIKEAAAQVSPQATLQSILEIVRDQDSYADVSDAFEDIDRVLRDAGYDTSPSEDY